MEELSNVKQQFIHYINHIIQNNKISHAYLIELDNYDTDYSFVMSFIKMILCNISYEELESSHNNIIHLVDSNEYPDIYTVSSDSSVINKSLISNLQKEFKNKSLLNNKKIYIIKEAEKMNASSANTILKFLEEPEDDIIAFLLTDDRYHVIETILSRCQVLSLKEEYSYDSISDSVLDILDIILRPENYFVQFNSLSKDLFVDKNELIIHFNEVEELLVRYLSNLKCNNKDSSLDSIFHSFSDTKLISILSVMEEEIPKLRYNVNLKLWLDSFFCRLIGG